MSDAPTDRELTGCMNTDRYFACIIDNALAMALAFVLAVKLAAYGTAVSWTGAALGYFGYFFLFEIGFRNTLGKWSSGLCVRTLRGNRCSRYQMFIRSFWRVLEVNPVLFGALPGGVALYFSHRRQRLGDLFAGTVVVRRSQVS